MDQFLVLDIRGDKAGAMENGGLWGPRGCMPSCHRTCNSYFIIICSSISPLYAFEQYMVCSNMSWHARTSLCKDVRVVRGEITLGLVYISAICACIPHTRLSLDHATTCMLCINHVRKCNLYRSDMFEPHVGKGATTRRVKRGRNVICIACWYLGTCDEIYFRNG